MAISPAESTPDIPPQDEHVDTSPAEPDISPEVPFAPLIIDQLPNMTIDQLAKLESQLSKEFSDLSRNYLDARKSRIDTLIKNVDAQIKTFQDNDAEWTDLYLNQIKALEDYVAYPEAVMQRAEKFHELIESVKLPYELDDVFSGRKDTLPFANYFRRIIQPHQKELMALSHLRTYLTMLVDQLAEKNRVILWNQVRSDIVEHKDKLIKDTYEELYQLHKEYYGVNSNEICNLDNQSYYRSVVPAPIPEPNEQLQARLSTDNIDSFNDIDNRYFKKNKIEITSTKYDALDQLHNFEQEQSSYAIPQLDNARVVLAGCLGLGEADIDADLTLIRGRKRGANDKEATGGSSKQKTSDETSSLEPKRLLYQDVLNMNRKSSQISITPLNSNQVKDEVAEMGSIDSMSHK